MERDAHGRKEEVRDWAVVVGIVVAILALVPRGRALGDWVDETLGARTLLGVAFLVLGIAILLLFRWGWPRLRTLAWPRLLAGAAVLGFLGWQIWLVRELPTEAMHVVLYAGLAIAVTRALRHRQRGWPALLTALLLCLSMGLIDEAYQWWFPHRWGELKDVLLNARSSLAALVLVALWGGWEQGDPRDRLLLGTFSATAALLLAFLHVTPQNIHLWTAPGAPLEPWAKVSGIDAGCIEYGTLHEIPGLARLKSRHADLAAFTDLENTILARPAPPQGKPIALEDLPKTGARDETGIRLFSRFRNLEKAFDPAVNQALVPTYLQRAWVEDALLQHLLPRALPRLGRIPTPAERARMEADRRPEGAGLPLSRVSANLCSAFSERQARWVLVPVIVAGLLVVCKRSIV